MAFESEEFKSEEIEEFKPIIIGDKNHENFQIISKRFQKNASKNESRQ